MGKCIVLTGGGTAGHVSANVALMPRFAEMGFSIHYIGTEDGIERKLVGAFPGVTYHAISAGKLRRYFDVKNLTDPFRVLRGVVQARRILRTTKPDVVFSKGGFVAVPVMAAAKLEGIPAVGHESDLTPGLANRISGAFAKNICTSFPQTVAQIGKKAVYTGAPIRAELFAGDSTRGRKMCGFPPDKPVLLLMGGSQGAAALNEALRGARETLLSRFCIIHLCGAGNTVACGIPGYFQMEYARDELPDLLAAADIVISRAGANSLFELAALRKSALLIPLPLSASRGDQIENARSFVEKGFSHMLPQEELTPASLVRAVDALWADRARCAENMRAGAPENGVENVLSVILSAIE